MAHGRLQVEAHDRGGPREARGLDGARRQGVGGQMDVCVKLGESWGGFSLWFLFPHRGRTWAIYPPWT